MEHKNVSSRSTSDKALRLNLDDKKYDLEDKVLKRFNLKAQGKEVLQVDYKKAKKVFFIPISPPSQGVELIFSKRQYEVPEKK